MEARGDTRVGREAGPHPHYPAPQEGSRDYSAHHARSGYYDTDDQRHYDLTNYRSETRQRTPAPYRMHSEQATRPIVKPDRFDGKENLSAYLQHFELCASLNKWDRWDKAQHLAISLAGEARQVITGIEPRQLYDYDFIIAALQNRFDPVSRTELLRIQLKNRVRGQSESLAELADSIRMLVERVYGDLPLQARDKMARDHFIDALNDGDIRMRVLQARTGTLQETVNMSMELEALQAAERERNPARRIRAVQQTAPADPTAELLKVVNNLAIQVQRLGQERASGKERRQYNQDRTPPVCFQCNQPGHLRRACPQLQQENFQ